MLTVYVVYEHGSTVCVCVRVCLLMSLGGRCSSISMLSILSIVLACAPSVAFVNLLDTITCTILVVLSLLLLSFLQLAVS